MLYYCMIYSPLAIKRRQVLGDIYTQCETIESVPVYLENNAGEMLGYADEGLGKFADAFLFHVSEDVCKKLSTNRYDYSFDYDYSEAAPPAGQRKRIKINFIVLVAKKKIA